MAKYEQEGYCPYNEIIHNEEATWKNLSDDQKGYRKALWELIGPYMVCKNPDEVPYTVQSSKFFFDTKSLADNVLKAVIKRYDFTREAPIWIIQPLRSNSIIIQVPEYMAEMKDKNPEMIFTKYDAGKVAIISDGNDGEVFIAIWII